MSDPLEVTSQIQNENCVEIISQHEINLYQAKKLVFPVFMFGIVMLTPFPTYASYSMFLREQKKITITASQPETIKEIGSKILFKIKTSAIF